MGTRIAYKKSASKNSMDRKQDLLKKRTVKTENDQINDPTKNWRPNLLTFSYLRMQTKPTFFPFLFILVELRTASLTQLNEIYQA